MTKHHSCQKTNCQTIIIDMSRLTQNNKGFPKKTPSLWKAIVLVIIFVFMIVVLFGLILYLLVNGAQQLGISRIGYIVIFVLISGVFAWLIKRISDTASSMSHLWFPEESDKQD